MGFKKLKNGLVYLSKKAKKLVSFKIIFALFLIAICWQFWVVKKELKAVEENAAQALIYAVVAGTRSYPSSSIDDLESRIDDLESKLNGVYGLEYKVSSLESESHSEYHSHSELHSEYHSH